MLSGADNVALGKTVTSLDSIEARPAWATKNLVDGFSSLASCPPTRPTGASRRDELAARSRTT